MTRFTRVIDPPPSRWGVWPRETLKIACTTSGIAPRPSSSLTITTQSRENVSTRSTGSLLQPDGLFHRDRVQRACGPLTDTRLEGLLDLRLQHTTTHDKQGISRTLVSRPCQTPVRVNKRPRYPITSASLIQSPSFEKVSKKQPDSPRPPAGWCCWCRPRQSWP